MNTKKAGQAGTPGHLSADRLASLSDTMFGVAMTLVVTTLLPSIQTLKGSVADIMSSMHSELITVVISFAVSARYWVAQQQRLAMTPTLTLRQTQINLIFLFLIVLVPISTTILGLAGSTPTRGSALTYGGHLTAISFVNLLLWIEVHRTTEARQQIFTSSLALALFLVALAVGAWRPDLAMYVWLAVLGTQPLGRYAARRLYPA